MGMAAGQARLLSITSRLSDNELRAQIINNDKMRLATQSSRVSEAYTTALNEAQYMFTNYDKENNATYQQLTFNSLTGYNQYNNQYALTNASGQVLVSEKDATNFKNSDGDLNTFLANYGLAQTTTYFDELSTKYGSDAEIQYMTGNLNADGTAIYASSGYTAKELEGIFSTYDVVKASDNYKNFTQYFSEFSNSYDQWLSAIGEKMKTTLNNTVITGSTKFSDFVKQANEENDIVKLKGYLDNLSAYLGGDFQKYNTDKTSVDSGGYEKKITDYVELEQKNNNNAKEGITEYNITDGYKFSLDGNIGTKAGDTTSIVFSKLADNSNSTTENSEDSKLYKISKEIQSVDANGNITYKDGYSVYVLGEPVDGKETWKKLDIKVDQYNKDKFSYKEDEEDKEDSNLTIPISKLFAGHKTDGTTNLDAINKDENTTVTYQTEVTPEDLKARIKSCVNSISYAIYSYWNPLDETFANNEKRDDCAKKAETLCTYLGISSNYATDSSKWSELCDQNQIKKIIDTNGSDKPVKDDKSGITSITKSDFNKIYEVIILDKVMDTFGEPKVAWIDKTNKNENGEAKAQWYTNLFTKMQSCGYKALQNGLAASPEWIKFAFESGLVTMEQIDSTNTWKSTSYTSCSDITEQTNNNAITIAEAEYNTAMNKIENKDKMYDLELKNIDTEHNSLQTEYESIKNAVDKNIERTFKMYS